MFSYIFVGIAGGVVYSQKESVVWGSAIWLMVGGTPAGFAGAFVLQYISNIVVKLVLCEVLSCLALDIRNIAVSNAPTRAILLLPPLLPPPPLPLTLQYPAVAPHMWPRVLTITHPRSIYAYRAMPPTHNLNPTALTNYYSRHHSTFPPHQHARPLSRRRQMRW